MKGFIHIDNQEVKKMFVEPVLQGRSIGSKLIDFAITEMNVGFLWALEKNIRAISFYERHRFKKTGDKKLEEATTEYLICMEQ